MLRFMDKMAERAALSSKMAKVVGADFGEALIGGRIGPFTLRSSVLSCMACNNTDACRSWLTLNAAGATEPPAFCRNSDLLGRLAG